MKIETRKFGAIDVQDDQKIVFVQPIIGFPHLLNFAVVDTGGPVKWLQSLDDEAVVFPVADPFAIKPDYDIELPSSEASMLEVDRVEDVQLLAIIVLSKHADGTRANLKAPIVINRRTRAAKQVVLSDNSLPIRYRFILADNQSNKEVANVGSYSQER